MGKRTRRMTAAKTAAAVPLADAPFARPSRADRRRVLLVTPGGLGERGGIGRLVNHIVGHCEAAGIGPGFIVIDPWGPRNLALMPFFFVRALAQIVWHVARGRVALMHVNMASWGSVARKGPIVQLARALRVPVVLHLHAGDFETFYGALPRIGQRYVRGLFAHCDRLIVLGEPWRRFLREVAGIPDRRILVLENAVAGPPAPPVRPMDGPCRLLFLGRIEPEKGIGELIEALADPRLRPFDWRASLGGAGDIAGYRRQAERAGIAERVEFLGWRPEAEARDLLGACDIFVLPSHFEGLSMAVLEAMAYGLAIVCTPVGSIPSAVEDEVSALFVPVGDAPALAGALLRLIAAPDLRARLQAAAREGFNRKFDIGLYCSVLEHTYDEVLGERHNSTGRFSGRHDPW
jgi:glycosyltransferase involved in cell wall biosynthesis